MFIFWSTLFETMITGRHLLSCLESNIFLDKLGHQCEKWEKKNMLIVTNTLAQMTICNSTPADMPLL